MVTTRAEVDPVKYEMFLHRMWAIGEEGRLSLQRVTASPIVAQGGECMSSFYTPSGVMVQACSGHLRFCHATSDALKKLIDWFSASPGFFDGDQFFFNDPYVAGSHTYDMMVIKPIFYDGNLIAWTATSTHTADTGGSLRGVATEVFHEGIRIMGLKVVEKGEFRDDVFKSLTEQCRDPQYVGLDMRAMIAGNNVCARRYLQLVDKYGPQFVQDASDKIIQDAERMARAKLLSLPNGSWMSRLYTTTLDRKERRARPFQVVCTVTKSDDELAIDFTGSSPQMNNDFNSSFPSTVAHVGVALTNQLFWDVPWSDGKLAPVKVSAPEGSVLNCQFPAACGFAPWVGQILVAAVSECLAKMLFAGGRQDDVNATWHGLWYAGGPGYLYGGHNREGIMTAQGIYDLHGGGLGAAPKRDGVPTGGHMNIPAGGITDVERIEMQYPLVYFTRNHNRDGGGFAKFAGGMGSQRLYMVYESQDFTVDFKPYGGIPQGGFGLFGGYPCGTGGLRAVFQTASQQVMSRLRSGEYPPTVEALLERGWGEIVQPEGAPERIHVPEHSIVADFVASGGGYGDPLDREPERVVRDVRDGAISRDVAERIYGVFVGTSELSLDRPATERLREAIRRERLTRGKPFAGTSSSLPELNQETGSAATAEGVPREWTRVIRFHEYLEVATRDRLFVNRCIRCGHVFCEATDNYKLYALRRVRDLHDLAGHSLPSGEPYLGVYHEYSCPGCATLLQVDTYCPSLGGDEVVWDIRLEVGG